jgi:hypothetical protein
MKLMRKMGFIIPPSRIIDLFLHAFLAVAHQECNLRTEERNHAKVRLFFAHLLHVELVPNRGALSQRGVNRIRSAHIVETTGKLIQECALRRKLASGITAASAAVSDVTSEEEC